MHSVGTVMGDMAMLHDYDRGPRAHTHVCEEDAIRIGREYADFHLIFLVSMTLTDSRHDLEGSAKPNGSAYGCHDDYGESQKLAEHMRKPFPGRFPMR